MKSVIHNVLSRCGLLAAPAPISKDAPRPRPAPNAHLLDPMEPRTLMAVFTVANLNDAGAGSLRQAISDANNAAGADVIDFQAGLTGAITLSSGELVVSDSLAINGPGASILSINGNAASRVLRFSSGTSSITGLTITGGNAFTGGGISNAGTLDITSSAVNANVATTAGGGGIENTGTLTLTDSTVANNDAGIGDGGAIRNAGILTVTRSSLFGNQGANGGAFANFGTALNIYSSTISGNTASIGGSLLINFNAVTIRNSTFAGDTNLSAITSSGTITMVSSILAGNSGQDMSGTFAAGSTNNIIQDAGNAGGLVNDANHNIIGVDPLLAVLADNGGPNLTHALLAGSPAISNGLNPDALTTDQRGQARLRGTAVDSGAFELSAIPTVASLTASGTYFSRGQVITFTANTVSDADGTIVAVNFFRDTNANGVADSGELIGTDTDSAGGYTFAYTVPDDFPYGPVSFLAVAADNDSSLSATRSTTLTVLSASQFAALPGQLLGASVGANGNINVTTLNAQGFPIVLQQGAGVTTWTGSDLQAKTGSPAITGEVVTWVDPKDSRTYAAAVSAQGLILFTNTTGNTWTFRNLTNEIVGLPAITSNLTVFSSTDQVISIAGVSAAGDLIRVFQTGVVVNSNYSWTSVNHGDDLRAQNLTAPVFTGRITSFVTSWNALNVVGLDAQGNIQAIWWHQSLATAGKWTTNNLSVEYGAPPLTGGLTVWLTSWNAINIAGTDTNGKLSATWWVPEYNNNQWQTDNLTDEFAGPNLQPDSMTSWVTPWGAMNIAGREADGTISVYWWVPNYNNNQWQVAHFRDVIPNATLTTGPVTGITAPGGDFSMSILSTSAGGEVIRLWWSPGSDWAEQNLTQIAVPA